MTVTRDGIYSDSIVRASRGDSLKMSALTDGHARERTGLEGGSQNMGAIQ